MTIKPFSLLAIPFPISLSQMEILQNSAFLRGLCRTSGPADLQYDNSSELFRISTYAKFPTTAAVTERSLARAGFYYTGLGDRVQCFRCNVTADNWQSGDCPAERHKQLSPNCSFIQSLPATANLLSSSHSAFSPLRNVAVLQLSAPATAAPSTTAPSTSGQTEEQVGYLNMGFTNLAPSSPISSRGVEDMSHQRPPACHNPGMRREQERLDTFQNWTLATVTPAELAKAGLYYLGQGDRVACFSCGGQLGSWEPGDRAVSEHQRHYPNCRFVRGDRADNIPLSGGGLSNVSNSAMQQCEERLLTFVNWPSRIPVRPDQLAKAGFYYVGRNDDVKCFCCDGGLRCWESGDDPWVEHAKWFPRCEYLLQEKGQEFVHQIQARFPRLFEQLLTNGDSNSREFVDPPVVHLGPGEDRSEDAVMMNNPVVKSALEMGFERGLVKQTVQSKILTSGENYKTVQELVSDLLSAEDEKREEERELLAEEMASDGFTFLKKHHAALSQRLKSVQSLMDHLLEENVISQKEYDSIRNCTSVKQQTGQLIDLVLSKGNAAAEVFRNWIKKNDVYLLRELMAQTNEAASPSQDLSDLPMEEQLRRLQEERTCKVCMDKEVNIVFIPCGHLVVCKECAPSLRKCPICRGMVKGTVRTFLS
ncbi:baculoviral IAP repeat-containing protein 2 isoform X1 [Danio rerio]|uniref:RING-type E3 ubiquitin transferase n=4 Tax=Danio rerio TaxID=7955 RepID=Q7T0K2_DANRE|nr:baculoviral IAP repeat-containing protein 2 isoform X1 [Danio rerio]XP_009293568.1 baculoviral IAP repeat-containing protein 2 isoform X1 [Danio rerio]AAP04483.1 inhibitor of apoptosis protein [Danio rerio]|eukprot:XP_005161213.1 baculoviral IAP repeat-containing protein 2 isoform X1 [Danio rerio]